MEKIYRKICVYKSRSHQQGLLPFIRFNEYVIPVSGDPFYYATSADTDGNFGGYVANPVISGEVINYIDYIEHYNQLMMSLMSGVKMKHVIKNGQDTWTPYYDVRKNIFSYKAVDASKIVSITEGRYYAIDGLEYTDEYEYINCISNYGRYTELSTLFGGVDNVYEKLKYIEDTFIGKLFIPEDIEGDLVPVFLNYCDIIEWLDWFIKHEYNTDCCIRELWKRKGGDKMYQFLKENKELYQEALDNAAGLISESGVSVPYLTVSLQLKNDISNLGVYLAYDDGAEDFCLDESILPEVPYEVDDFSANSKLKDLKVQQTYYSDNGIELPGLFVEETGVTFYRYNGSEWELDENTGQKLYTTYTCKESLPVSATTGTIAMVRYVNDKNNPLEIPYQVFGSSETYSPSNIHYVLDDDGNRIYRELEDGSKIYSLTGDFIKEIKINEDNDEIKFRYVIGGIWHGKLVETESGNTKDVGLITNGSNNGSNFFTAIDYIEHTGIEYEEAYAYEPSASDTYTIDRKEDVTIYYNKIDFEGNLVTITNEDLNLSRRGLLSNIVGMQHNSIWVQQDYLKTSGDSGNTCTVVNYPVYKHESLMGIDDDVIIDVDFTLDRGSASAFEKHLKLTECNTLQDLENYSNNIFNL